MLETHVFYEGSFFEKENHKHACSKTSLNPRKLFYFSDMVGNNADNMRRILVDSSKYLRKHQNTPEHVRIRQNTSEDTRIRQIAPKYARIRKNTPEYTRILQNTIEHARIHA